MATIIDDTSEGWVQYQGSGTLAYTTANAKEDGSSAIEVTQSAPSTRERWRKDVTPFALTADDIYGVWLEMPNWETVDNANNDTGRVNIYFWQGTEYATRSLSQDCVVGWHLAVWQVQDMTSKTAGWNDLGNVDRIIVDVESRVTAAQTVRFNRVFRGLQDDMSKARVMFRNDDGLLNFYDRSFPIMQAKGYKPLVSVIGNNIGAGPTVMTAEQITELYNAGYWIGNHGHLSPPLTTFTPISAAISEVTQGRADLAQWPTPANCFIYAEGETGDLANYPNRELIDMVLANGETIGWQIAKYATGFDAEHRGLLGDLGNMPTYLMDNGLSEATVLAAVDKAIRLKQTIMLGWHSLTDATRSGTSMIESEFQTIVDYVAAKETAGDLEVLDPQVWGTEFGLWEYSAEPQTDLYRTRSTGLDSPGRGHFAITPSDTVYLEMIPRFLYVGGAGSIALEDESGVTLTYLNASGKIPLRAAKVKATGTTATGIIGIY